MIKKNINIAEFLKKFNEEYEFLYDNRDIVAGYNEALDAFDTFAVNNKNFIMEFVEFRKDFISSDREAVAFMFAMDSMVD